MPTTPLRNRLYSLALPLAAPSPRGQMHHNVQGRELNSLAQYEHILRRHHVLGSSLMLTDGSAFAVVHTSIDKPSHRASASTMYRVASITKMATALVTLMLCDQGAFSLDTPVNSLLPQSHAALSDVTVSHLLCHTSGLRDTPAYEQALREGESYLRVLDTPDVRASMPGAAMAYCNFGFGLLGCVMEHITGTCLEDLFQQKLFVPLGMRATLNASSLNQEDIMPISRVLPYRKGCDVVIPPLGRKPLNAPDPLRHFGHTAGSMYTDPWSLSRMMRLISDDGIIEKNRLLSSSFIHEMTTQHAFTGPQEAPIRRYGLGLVLLNRPDLSSGMIYGHQGFAYGCVDGAFWEADTGRQVIFLNGGASEARDGRLGICNRDVLSWALKEEIPSWT